MSASAGKNVTAETRFGNPDDEHLPLLQCVCGVVHSDWSIVLSIYPNDPYEMPCCGRRLYFTQRIQIIEVEP